MKEVKSKRQRIFNYLNGIQQEIYFTKYKLSELIVIIINVIKLSLNDDNYSIAPSLTLIFILANKQPDVKKLINLIKD